MEKETVQIEEQKKTEQYVLFIYSVYCIILTVVAMRSRWPAWIAVVLDLCFFTSLVMYVVKFRDYQFRAFFMASLMQINVVMWSVYIASLPMTVPVLGALTVALGLYGIPEILYIPVASATFLNFYHLLLVHSVDMYSKQERIQTVLEIVSVYFVAFVMYTLNKKRLEDSERQMGIIESLKEAERSKDDFLANVSHEIRTPINTICGMSEIVLREELEEAVRADVFSIQAAGRNLLSVVSDVLDFSELQSGKMTLAQEAYNITSTINDIINMSMARKSEKQIELVVDCSADIPCSLYGDEQKIRRVIMNLVNNALKFTVEGCVSIIIQARKTDYGINLIVRVRDTGIGLKEESVEKLFTSFNQVDTKRNRQEGGIGLGLAISQAMVDKMGGFINVQSEYGKGSEVQFVIPQKVLDDRPIAVVRDPERLNVAVYINMEQFSRTEIRDEYGRVIFHMIEQLKVKNHLCRNFQELKRRVEREIYSHIFISIVEYEEGREYFDKMSEMTKVIIILDRPDDAKITNHKILRLYKPFFILPIVMILNDEKMIQGMDENNYHRGKFIAPDTSVLAVDDNLMNIRVLEGLLRPYKIKVSMATSGAEALEKIESMDYDFIFMDHMMPEMDGIETLHRIRQKQGNYFKKIPVIALTANAIGGMREVFLEEGFQDFMAKPIELSVLERVLRRNLPQEKMIQVENIEEESSSHTLSVHLSEDAQQNQTGDLENSHASQTSYLEDSQRIQIDFSDNSYRNPIDSSKDGRTRQTDLPAGRFDEQMGMRYCGGLENYIDILRLVSKGGQENKAKLQKSFDKRDWKNYTIYAHALKSSMINIGAEKLSNMAKELEGAGKRNDEAFIREHHDKMMLEYAQILTAMKESKMIYPDVQQEDVSDLEPLEETQLNRLALEFEDAAFAFDEEEMMAIADRLSHCSYHGHSLKEPMKTVVQKIGMSDYMSASETISRLKEKFS